MNLRLLPALALGIAFAGFTRSATAAPVDAGPPTPVPAKDAREWRSGRLQAPGATLFYAERGRGESIVFVHDALADSRAWREIGGTLASSHHVVTYSRRGHEPGRIDPKQALAAAEVHARDLITLIQAIDGEPVHVVGAGEGAVVALLAAREKPHLVKSLVLIEPGLDALIVDPQLRRAASRRRAETARGAEAACLEDDSERAVRIALAGQTGDSTAFDRLPPDVRAMLVVHAPLLAAYPTGAPPGCGDVWRVRTPTLVVADAPPDIEDLEYGDGPMKERPIADPRSLAADGLARCLKSAERFALADRGPLPQYRQPGPLARAVGAFVEKNARGRLASE